MLGMVGGQEVSSKVTISSKIGLAYLLTNFTWFYKLNMFLFCFLLSQRQCLDFMKNPIPFYFGYWSTVYRKMCRNIGWYFIDNLSGPIMIPGCPIVTMVILEINNRIFNVKKPTEPVVIAVCRTHEVPIDANTANNLWNSWSSNL